MLRNNYSEVLKKFSGGKNFREVKNLRMIGAKESTERVRLPPSSFSSDLVVDYSRRLSPIIRLVDLEVREKRGTLLLKQLEHRHRAAADLELRYLARS